MKRAKKIALWVLGVLVVLGLALAITLAVANEPRPEGRPGAAADALATRIEASVDLDAWARTGAVRWNFGGRQQHLWDRRRHLVRVRWGGQNEALLHEGGPDGRAYVGGREVEGAEARAMLEEAHGFFINDSFWLNPISKFRDEGVSLGTVDLPDGPEALLVSYGSGGLTPGDAYLWIPGPDGTPREWRMWVSIIPVGGVSTTWSGWQTLATGARVSTVHEGPLGITLRLTDVEGAETLAALVDGPDPFAPIDGAPSESATR